MTLEFRIFRLQFRLTRSVFRDPLANIVYYEKSKRLPALKFNAAGSFFLTVQNIEAIQQILNLDNAWLHF